MSRKKDIPVEKKVEIVRAYNRKEIGLMEASRQGGVNFDTIMSWVRNYESEGVGAFLPHRNRTYTAAERIEIAKACLANGKNDGEAALKYQVSYQQARSWTRRFEELGEVGLEDRRGKRKKDQESRTELEKMQIEIEQLKHKRTQ